MNKLKKNNQIHNIRLNFWELAFIIFGSIGLSGIFFGSNLAETYGINNCIGSFFISNITCWLIGMIVVSMSFNSKSNAITNIQNQLGKKISIIAAICLLFSFLSWYVLQLNVSNHSINSILNINKDISTLRSGAAIGFFATLLLIAGIRIIKYFAVIAGGLIIIFIFSALIFHHKNLVVNPIGFSLKVYGLGLFFLLPAMLNLPTFFRYSKSKVDSYLALCIIFLVLTFVLISSLWLDKNILFSLISNYFQGYHYFFKLLIIFLITIFTIGNLMVNVFFASACWEGITKKIIGTKEYAIIGLFFTVAYTFFQITPLIEFLMDLANYFIAILVLVLIITYILSFIKNNSFVRTVGGISWILGIFTATVLEYNNPTQKIHTLSISLGVTCLFFIVSFFLEEFIWSIKTLFKRKKN